MWADGKVQKKIYYGPGSLRLLQVSDLNMDGKMDTMTYYNASQLKGNNMRDVAYKEIDVDGDGDIELWYYPGARLEYDLDNNGKADHIIEGDDKMGQVIMGMVNDLSLEKLQGSPLNASRAWSISGVPRGAGEHLQRIIQTSIPVEP